MGKAENEITRKIFEFLAIRNIMAWRNNAIPAPGRRFTGRKGVPDILGIYNGKFLGIEVKTSKGTQSPEQIEFQQECVANGGIYILARKLEDVVEAL